MSSLSPTPLSEMSSNILAALVLLLLAALALGGGTGQEREKAVARRALDSAEMIDLLYARRAGDGGIGVDVFDDRVEIFAAPGRTPIRAPIRARADADAIAAALPSEEVRGAARLFVFGHGAYRAATEALARRGLGWREISVPQAFRARGDAGWSPAFLTLIQRAGTREAFKDGLARLLAGGGAYAGAGAERWTPRGGAVGLFAGDGYPGGGFGWGARSDGAGGGTPLFFARAQLGIFFHVGVTLLALVGCAILTRWIEKRD